MSVRTPIYTLFSLLVFLLFSFSLLAQQNLVVHLNGTQMRAPLDVPEGSSTIQLCDLTPGTTYSVYVLGAAMGQEDVFSIVPSNTEEAGRLVLLPGKQNAARFTAQSACVDIPVLAHSKHVVTTMPMFLSIRCDDCARDHAWKDKFIKQLDMVNLSTTRPVDPHSLITNTLIGGNCFQATNINSQGDPTSQGTFSNGLTNIGLASGMVLCTGDVDILPGPNSQAGASGGFGNGSSDPDIGSLNLGNQFDLSKIEFDFTPTANTVQFEYVFGSEEYCEYVNTQFNDVFGFFISGPGITGTQNIAKVPSTNTPVSINNVNHLTNSSYYINNNDDSFGCLFLPQAAPFECELDGWTKVFVATVNVVPCSTYHIKLAISDIGDPSFASAVFLKANSFDAGGAINAEAVYPGALPNAYEDCGTGFVRFSRGSGNNSLPLPVTFSISPGSTATPGVDYSTLTSPVVIPAGQNEILVPITVFPDTLTEGTEQFVLLFDNSCSCAQQQLTYVMKDKPALSADLDDQNVCSGGTATLTPVLNGGVSPFNYSWSNGPTTPSITITTSGINTYTVTVSDFCATKANASAAVQITPALQFTDTLSFCSGGSVTLNGVVYTQPGTVTDTLPGSPGGCDSVLTYVLVLLSQPVLSDTITFCPGGSVSIGGVVYTGAGTVTDTLSGLNGACDTIITYVLEALAYPTSSDTINFCSGSSVNIGGVVYTQPGTVVDTIPGVNGGCDTIVTYTLEILPQLQSAQTLTFCPGGSVSIGGTVYTASGTVVDTIAGHGGSCDTIITYTLQLLPQPTLTDTITLCPGGSVSIGGMVYNAAGTVVDTIQGTNGACDTIATYTIVVLPQPARSETITFCPGDSITIGGTVYTASGTVILTLPGLNGACDTIVTYTLQSLTPAASTVKITCPANIGITVAAGDSPGAVDYNQPVASSDCPCPGLSLDLTSGLASGTVFPLGSTTVCYQAKDLCGNTATCCFKVEITESEPCDIKVIGCMRFELLTITENSEAERTYRIRVTNNCSNKLVYALFQIPNGQVAVEPADNTIYNAPSGRTYLVRNPNESPFYSTRFKSLSDSIANGQSDIFKYTLPTQSSPTYIHASVRLSIKEYFEVHLNTFYCPIGVTPEERSETTSRPARALSIFPNPTNGTLFADLSAWQGERVQLIAFDARGQRVLDVAVNAELEAQVIPLPNNLADGLYALQVLRGNGEREVLRFVVVN